ncbi:hypothetical protein B0H13DRAFT_1889965 [Mycena leptocephala]|nr:hypothetical protein B0H13DRAFT_1889965 [Mycena leptocephala]
MVQKRSTEFNLGRGESNSRENGRLISREPVPLLFQLTSGVMSQLFRRNSARMPEPSWHRREVPETMKLLNRNSSPPGSARLRKHIFECRYITTSGQIEERNTDNTDADGGEMVRGVAGTVTDECNVQPQKRLGQEHDLRWTPRTGQRRKEMNRRSQQRPGMIPGGEGRKRVNGDHERRSKKKFTEPALTRGAHQRSAWRYGAGSCPDGGRLHEEEARGAFGKVGAADVGMCARDRRLQNGKDNDVVDRGTACREGGT